jgi:signal peptidase II
MTAQLREVAGVKKYIIMALLILSDQLIKITIKLNFMDYDKILIWEFVRFKPVKNVDLSWINSSLKLGFGFLPHILINVIGIIFIYYLYKFYLSKSRETIWNSSVYALIMAGAFCSLIDKTFWGGSLDYIKYTGFLGGYTFDLKDVYISTVEVIIVVILIISLFGGRKYFESLNSFKFRELAAFAVNDFKKFIKKIGI